VTLITASAGLTRQFIQDFTLTTSGDGGISISETWNAHDQKTQTTRADRRGSESLSETARIEMRQLELLKTDQSQQSVIHYKILND